MTLDKLYTITTVDFSGNRDDHLVLIDGKQVTGKACERVVKHVDMIQRKTGKKQFARIASENNFPKKAGLASSASAFAALTLATVKALDLQLTSKELSIFSRMGSGSASRSIEGGFVEWLKGEQHDGSDSYAQQLAPKNHWPDLTMIVTILNPREKKVDSRTGMKQTVATSPLYKTWLDTVDQDVENAKKGILEKDFSLLGTTVEMNALKMHSTMHTTTPPLIYWEPETVTLIKEVITLRDEGTECYFTMDAGPQVKILCLEKDVPEIKKRFAELAEVQDYFVCYAGDGASISDEHLF